MLLTIGRVRNTVGGVVGVAAAVVVVFVVVEMGERAFAGVLDPVGEMILSTGVLPSGLWRCGKENGVCGVWNGEVRDKEVELDWIEPDVDWV